MLIYFAGPLFCQAEIAFNLQLTEELEEQGFTVFLPQRDGVEVNQPPYRQMSSEERTQAIFTTDRDKVYESDIFLFVLDGRIPDEGACLELGLAYAQRQLLSRPKLLVGLHTDMRGAFLDAKLNAMIAGALDSVVDNEDDLFHLLADYRRRFA